MSVIVKGMEMPSECEYCGFCRYYPESGNVWCNVKNRLLKQRWKEPGWSHLDVNVKRPDWCPLVELPEHHGDLIDRDAFKHDYRFGNDCDDCVMDWKSCQYDQIYSKMDFCQWLDDAAVVLEAEGVDGLANTM